MGKNRSRRSGGSVNINQFINHFDQFTRGVTTAIHQLRSEVNQIRQSSGSDYQDSNVGSIMQGGGKRNRRNRQRGNGQGNQLAQVISQAVTQALSGGNRRKRQQGQFNFGTPQNSVDDQYVD